MGWDISFNSGGLLCTFLFYTLHLLLKLETDQSVLNSSCCPLHHMFANPIDQFVDHNYHGLLFKLFNPSKMTKFKSSTQDRAICKCCSTFI